VHGNAHGVETATAFEVVKAVFTCELEDWEDWVFEQDPPGAADPLLVGPAQVLNCLVSAVFRSTGRGGCTKAHNFFWEREKPRN
jgi:hypothetical protein